ncbi:MAG TPA: RICIN domain-containing protein [Planctomycetaceae bacterium]|nr:RICIN domain-containing protein [Planctomycetaceae bacterium]
MQRRNFLKLSVAGAAAGSASLLGVWPAGAQVIGPLRAAPTTPFAVGVRRFDWFRGSRAVTTYIYYPATGAAGGNPVNNAPLAEGLFPICEFMHGFGSSPQNSLAMIRPLAAAGFIVPAPHFPNLNINDVYNGNQSKDISELITRTLALNGPGTPFTGRMDTSVGVGVGGHSMGGMTTHGLLTAWPDSRITAAIPQSCVDMGNPSSSVKAKVLFMHGDRDSTTQYSSARQAYTEMPPTKAFLTFVGGSHTSMWSDPIMARVGVDWMRWSLYGDSAAKDRLAGDAASSHTRWELVDNGEPVPNTFTLAAQHSGKFADIDGVSTAAGASLIQWSSTGRLNQQFQFIDAGDGHVRIMARHSSLFLQVASNADGADITQQPNNGSTNQQWRIEDRGGSVVSLINRQSGKAMDVWGRSTADGARISQYAYNTSNTNQRFLRRPV